MALTEAQRTTLAAHIRANTDQAVIDALAARNDTELASLYNAESSYVVWQSVVTVPEYKGALVWSEVDALTAGKARIWEWVTGNQTVDLDATDLNIRQGILDAFAGTTSLDQLTNVAKKNATLAQSIYATGTGTTQDPGINDFDELVTIHDIGRALNDNP